MNLMDESNSNKRAREEEDLSSSLLLSNTASEEGRRPAAPKYGSKEYWEARYRSHIPGVLVPATNEENSNDNNANTNAGGVEEDENSTYKLDGVILSKEAIKPGHEWYFSYEELRPLILPLILENVDNNGAIDQSEYDHDDAESWVEEEEEENDGEEEGIEVCSIESVNGEGGGDKNEEKSDGSDESTAKKGQSTCDKEEANQNNSGTEKPSSTNGSNRKEKDIEEGGFQSCPADTAFPWAGEMDASNMSNKPKKILEVGCGDKPLGTSLASDLMKLSSDTGDCGGAQCFVEEVTCIDYSEIVVQGLIAKQSQAKEEEDLKQPSSTTMKDDNVQQQSQNENDHKQLRATFQAMDARSLPYPANTYDLIIEKGTLDAMLSDEEEGILNCIQIVKEMARVTSEGGAIFIVSHLNANESKGMGWLEDVVFRGLKDEFLERHERLKNEVKRTAKKLRVESEAPGECQVNDIEKEYVWSVEVHGGDGQYLDANGDEVKDPDDDAVPIYGPAVYIIRKKSVPASIARELFGKKKGKGTTSAKQEGGIDNEGTENDKAPDSEGGDEEELVEMPPVKLSYITYGGD